MSKNRYLCHFTSSASSFHAQSTYIDLLLQLGVAKFWFIFSCLCNYKSITCIFFHSWLDIFQAECYHYLFDAAIKLNQLGLDCATPNHGPIQNVKGILGSNGNINMSTKAMTGDSNSISDPLPVRILPFLPFRRYIYVLNIITLLPFWSYKSNEVL